MPRDASDVKLAAAVRLDIARPAARDTFGPRGRLARCSDGRRCRDRTRALDPCCARNPTPECVIRGLVPDRKATRMHLAAVHECVLERQPESIPNATGVRLAYGKKRIRTRALSDRGVPDARTPPSLRSFDTSPASRWRSLIARHLHRKAGEAQRSDARRRGPR